MTEYAYKVMLTNEDCLAKRAVPFHSPDFLNYSQAGDEAIRHMTSQTCPRCNVNHPDDTYVATHVERGEVSLFGFVQYRDVYPGRPDPRQYELAL